MPTESTLQAYIKKICTEHGILCYKFSSPAHRGVPDLLLIGYGQTIFIEVKHPNGRGRLSPLQERTIHKMRDHGAQVHVIDNKQDADRVIELIRLHG